MVSAVGAGGVARLAGHGIVRIEPRELTWLKHEVAASSHPVVAAASSSVAGEGVDRA